MNKGLKEKIEGGVARVSNNNNNNNNIIIIIISIINYKKNIFIK